jgi:hypothetical protein
MGEFRTKLDYSDNRQIKQRTRTNTVLSGSSVFGVPFSGLTNGPDLDTTTVTETVLNVISTFSGNTGTTVWTFGDTRMSIGESALSAITPSNSGVTQDIGDAFISASSTIIDGNTVNLTYTGVSYTMRIDSMTDIGGGSYTGSGSTSELEILSADTLDFTGRTIWVEVPEILKTNKLIVSDGAVAGYVLTSDGEGMATWQAVSGATSADTFTITTGFTADVTQTINHNLGTGQLCSVILRDTNTNEEIGGVIDNFQTNSVDITFSQTLSSVLVIVKSLLT